MAVEKQSQENAQLSRDAGLGAYNSDRQTQDTRPVEHLRLPQAPAEDLSSAFGLDKFK